LLRPQEVEADGRGAQLFLRDAQLLLEELEA
jgi:hypothetical protein